MKELLGLMLVIGFVFLLSADGLACSCSLGSVQQKLKIHPNVFVGTATRVERPDEENGWGEQRIRVYFEVEKRWKGEPDENMLDTWDNKVSCEGYWFKEDRKYIVYAGTGENGFSVSYCGGADPVTYGRIGNIPDLDK